MIDPDTFYTEDDLPPQKSVNTMWNRIAHHLFRPRSEFQFRFDRNSFLYGIAASVVLYFAGLGIATTVQTYIDRSQPTEVRAEKAYRSAIQELESVVLPSVNPSNQQPAPDRASLNKVRLQYLNEAIDELRNEIGSNDIASTKRQRLNRLYTLKLSVLQEMLQQGEVQI